MSVTELMHYRSKWGRNRAGLSLAAGEDRNAGSLSKIFHVYKKLLYRGAGTMQTAANLVNPRE